MGRKSSLLLAASCFWVNFPKGTQNTRSPGSPRSNPAHPVPASSARSRHASHYLRHCAGAATPFLQITGKTANRISPADLAGQFFEQVHPERRMSIKGLQ